MRPTPIGRTTSRASADCVERRRAMARTRSFKNLVEHHIKGDSKFAEALLREGIDAMLSGDLDTGKNIMRDYIKATAEASPLDPGKIRDRAGGGADFVQEAQPVLAQRSVIDIDRDL